MFRLMGSIYKDTRLITHLVIPDAEKRTRTQKVFAALDTLCYEFDLPKPIWLDSNIHGFQQFNKTRFSADSFIETINFDFFEIEVLEED